MNKDTYDIQRIDGIHFCSSVPVAFMHQCLYIIYTKCGYKPILTASDVHFIFSPEEFLIFCMYAVYLSHDVLYHLPTTIAVHVSIDLSLGSPVILTLSKA
jgi:hypothetical protein